MIPSRKATPRDEATAADATPWNEIQAPEANRPESVYLHELAADENGRGWHGQRGDPHTIAPQTSERKSLTFTVIEGEAAIDALVARRDALLDERFR